MYNIYNMYFLRVTIVLLSFWNSATLTHPIDNFFECITTNWPIKITHLRAFVPSKLNCSNLFSGVSQTGDNAAHLYKLWTNLWHKEKIHLVSKKNFFWCETKLQWGSKYWTCVVHIVVCCRKLNNTHVLLRVFIQDKLVYV